MTRRKYQPRDGMDTGAPLLHRHFTVVPRLVNPTTMTMKSIDQTEADKMLMNDTITPAEHGTLNTLAKRLREYGYDDLRSPNYDGVISSDPELVSAKKADKIRGAVALIDRMDKHPGIGRYRRKKLINLALIDAPWGNKRNQVEDLKATIAAMDEIFMRR
jgi:hypothetical protein